MFIAVPASKDGLQKKKEEFGVNFMTSQFRVQWSQVSFFKPRFRWRNTGRNLNRDWRFLSENLLKPWGPRVLLNWVRVA